MCVSRVFYFSALFSCVRYTELGKSGNVVGDDSAACCAVCGGVKWVMIVVVHISDATIGNNVMQVIIVLCIVLLAMM